MNCPCGEDGDRLRQYFTRGETDFRLCPSCGLVSRKDFPGPDELDAMYRQAYEEEKIVAETTDQESGDFASSSYADYLARHVVKSADRVLDYGAGSGVLVSELRERGLDCDGVEFSEGARDYCFSSRGLSLREDLEDVPDGVYRAIAMIEVIEHLSDLTRTLRDLHRVLAPGGRIFITTPNRTGIRARIENGNWREARKKFHLLLFDRSSLGFHLQRAGFNDVQQIFFSPLQKPGWKFRVFARTMQAIRMPGTLCVLASKRV